MSRLIGQKQIWDYFQKVIEQNCLSHAYLIEGEPGSGKKTLVNQVIAFLLCTSLERICGQCRDCIQFQSHNHPDVIYVMPGKKNGYGVEDIREQVLEDVEIKPYQSDYKIFVVTGAESMSVPAQNAFLKTLENPPRYALFFLLTKDRQQLLNTIRSRCVELKMKNLLPEEMLDFLKSRDLSRYADYIPYAAGNPGRLLAAVESDGFRQLKSDMEILLEEFIKTPEHDIIKMIGILKKYSEELNSAIELLQILLHERMAVMDFGNELYLKYSAPARYYALARNLMKANQAIKSNVNKDLIIWSLFI